MIERVCFLKTETAISALLLIGALCLAVAGFLVAIPLGFVTVGVQCFAGAVLLVKGAGEVEDDATE